MIAVSEDNFYHLTYGYGNGQAIAQDATFGAMKSNLAYSLPKRMRIRKDLIDSIPRSVSTNIIYGNVSLIKTIPSSEHERITRYIRGVFTGRYTREQLIAYLERIGDVTEERAVMIADDQITKAAALFQVEMWKGRGVTRVRWVHEGGNEPRAYHIGKWNRRSGRLKGNPNALNGFEFDINNPPIIDQKTGERGYPGQLVNCHCKLEIIH